MAHDWVALLIVFIPTSFGFDRNQFRTFQTHSHRNQTDYIDGLFIFQKKNFFLECKANLRLTDFGFASV